MRCRIPWRRSCTADQCLNLIKNSTWHCCGLCRSVCGSDTTITQTGRAIKGFLLLLLSFLLLNLLISGGMAAFDRAVLGRLVGALMNRWLIPVTLLLVALVEGRLVGVWLLVEPADCGTTNLPLRGGQFSCGSAPEPLLDGWTDLAHVAHSHGPEAWTRSPLVAAALDRDGTAGALALGRRFGPAAGWNAQLGWSDAHLVAYGRQRRSGASAGNSSGSWPSQ